MAENCPATVDEHQDQAVRDSDVHVSATAVELLRDGVRSQIAVVAQHITSAHDKEDARKHPERYQQPLRQMDSLGALLEAIGLDTPPDDLRVDSSAHGWALMEALGDQISVHADMLRHTQDDKGREAIARNMDALTPLALAVLLRTQADILLTTTLVTSPA